MRETLHKGERVPNETYGDQVGKHKMSQMET